MADPEPFGVLPDGQPVQLYRLRSESGVEVSACTYGATITSIVTAGRDGTRANVVLGFETVAPYLSQTAFLGAVVGRYANRIARARFVLDGHDLSAAAQRRTEPAARRRARLRQTALERASRLPAVVIKASDSPG